jgi:hypothetical protein
MATRSKATSKTKAKPAEVKAKSGKSTRSKSNPVLAKYERQLDALEKRLAAGTDTTALRQLTLDFHSLTYSLGHDMQALAFAKTTTVATFNHMVVVSDRAYRGKLAANERASTAYAAAGNVRSALHHLWEGLEMDIEREARNRIAMRAADVLEPHQPNIAKRLRELTALPKAKDVMKDKFGPALYELKYGFEWDTLPGD